MIRAPPHSFDPAFRETGNLSCLVTGVESEIEGPDKRKFVITGPTYTSFVINRPCGDVTNVIQKGSCLGQVRGRDTRAWNIPRFLELCKLK